MISGNSTGIQLDTAGFLVQGNIIGLDANGALALGNSGAGIYCNFNGDMVIGGTAPGAGNIISGNGSHGIDLEQNQPHDIVIQGNRIGTDYQGFFAVPNQGYGIYVFAASETQIGGSAPGAGNLISGNLLGGIFLTKFSTVVPTDNVIQGNLIGTDITGTVAGRQRRQRHRLRVRPRHPRRRHRLRRRQRDLRQPGARRPLRRDHGRFRQPQPRRREQHRYERLWHGRSRKQPRRSLLREQRAGLRARRDRTGRDESHRVQRGAGRRLRRCDASTARTSSTATAGSAWTGKTTASLPTSLPELSSTRTPRSSQPRPRHRRAQPSRARSPPATRQPSPSTSSRIPPAIRRATVRRSSISAR